MLSEIYQYAIKNNLAATPGYKFKKPSGYISLLSNGEFLGIDPPPEEAVYCPDIGSAAQGPTKSNVLIEKAEVVLGINNRMAKHEFFVNALIEGGEYVPEFKICAEVLQKEEIKKQIEEALTEKKIKPDKAIGLKVDGIAIERNIEKYADWWKDFREKFSGEKDTDENRCLITGDLAPSVRIVPKVSGLASVGGHTAGDALICFDKDAFQSYGLDQAANAAVSEEAIAAVNAALTELIKKSPILAGAKWIHWYDKEIPEEADLFETINDSKMKFEEGEEEEEEVEEEEEESPHEKAIYEKSKQAKYIEAANNLIKSAYSGENPEVLRARYHILSLSGANGRMMLRMYTQGSYEDLYNNMKLWFDDLRIVSPKGYFATLPPKMRAINIRLLGSKKSSSMNKLSQRIDNELSSLETQLITSIISGGQLPDAVAAKSLQYIRSDIFSGKESETTYSETVSYQLLKAWLIRIQRKRGKILMTEKLNEENTSVAYLSGRMMAVFAKIQENALGDVNAGVVQRFYTAASTSPALVLGRLFDLSQHHFGKLDKGTAVFYGKKLTEISSKIKGKIPTTMTLEQKTEFALGYYQQLAEIYTKKDTEEK